MGETGPLIVSPRDGQLVGMPVSRSGDLSRVDVTRPDLGEYAISRKLQIAEASRKRCAPREVCGELSRLRDMGCFVAGVRIPAAGIHPR